MGRLNITVLRCPLCGVDLEGMDRDVVFFCRHCHQGYKPADSGKLKEVPVFYQPPGVDVGNSALIMLPMWALKINLEFNCDPKYRKRLKQAVGDIEWAWITAFRSWRPSYFGDPGLMYTAGKIVPPLTPAIPENIPCGCSTTAEEALQYPKPFLLSIIDRIVDVTDIDVFIEIIDQKLVSVPFVDTGEHILDTQIKWQWPSIFVEDIVPVRKILRENV